MQDRYDIDGDGNFNEPDGFIDHFQIVHAGGDEAAGDPITARRHLEPPLAGSAQRHGRMPVRHRGVRSTRSAWAARRPGVQIPHNPTGFWVCDYTIQPENGGLGVFAHEFGHDLGLPDLYDTSGNTGGAEN